MVRQSTKDIIQTGFYSSLLFTVCLLLLYDHVTIQGSKDSFPLLYQSFHNDSGDVGNSGEYLVIEGPIVDRVDF